MTLDLDAIAARCAAATPGPWTAGGAAVFKTVPYEANTNLWTRVASSTATQEDAAFIASARTDVPALVARVRELEAEVDRMRPVYDMACEYAVMNWDDPRRDVLCLELEDKVRTGRTAAYRAQASKETGR